MTYIGNENRCDDNELLIRKLIEHYKKLLEIDVNKENYQFEYFPYDQYLLDLLDVLKKTYKELKSNISNLEAIETELFYRYVYGSTAIEGITLNLFETRNLLEAELTPAHRPLKHSLAVNNFKAVKKYVDSYKGEINEKFILTLHYLIMNNLNEGEAGKYRKTERGVSLDINHSKWHDIPKDIDRLLTWYNHNKNILHPLELISRFHQWFEEIHPFHDGNGRTGRAIIDFMLKENGYPPIYVNPNKRYDYQTALRQGNKTYKKNPNYTPLIEFIISRVFASFMYIILKSEMKDVIESNEFKQFFTSEYSPELYNFFSEQIKEFKYTEMDLE
jgi:Fic family protein